MTRDAGRVSTRVGCDRLHHPALHRRRDHRARRSRRHVCLLLHLHRRQPRPRRARQRGAKPAAVAVEQAARLRPAARHPVRRATWEPRSTSTSATPTSRVRASRALFNENAGRSAYLSGAALVLALLIAMPLGIAQAVKRNSDRRLRRHGVDVHALLDAVVLPRPDPDPVPRPRPAHLPAVGRRQRSRPPGRRSRTRAR